MRRLLKIFILLLFFACNNDDLDLERPIDSDLKIELREWISPDKQGLHLQAATERIYPCVNYLLMFDQHFDRKRIVITFTGVIETNICLTALGPATASIYLSHLEKGIYELELNNGALKNHGKLVITDTETKLEFATQNGVQIMKDSP